jgi:hypothetical protein
MFWANLTPFSPQVDLAEDEGESLALELGVSEPPTFFIYQAGVRARARPRFRLGQSFRDFP